MKRSLFYLIDRGYQVVHVTNQNIVDEGESCILLKPDVEIKYSGEGRLACRVRTEVIILKRKACQALLPMVDHTYPQKPYVQRNLQPFAAWHCSVTLFWSPV